MDVHELVRLKRAGRSNSEISRLPGCDRKTTQKSVKWAGRNGPLDAEGALPGAVAAQALLDQNVPQR